MLIVLGLYAAGWLASSRLLYSRWRGLDRGRRDCHKHGSTEQRYIRNSTCCYDKATGSDGEACTYAMIAGLLWPLVVLTALVRFHPKPTSRELAEAEEARTKRIAELERENETLRGAQ